MRSILRLRRCSRVKIMGFATGSVKLPPPVMNNNATCVEKTRGCLGGAPKRKTPATSYKWVFADREFNCTRGMRINVQINVIVSISQEVSPAKRSNMPLIRDTKRIQRLTRARLALRRVSSFCVARLATGPFLSHVDARLHLEVSSRVTM